MRSCSEFVPLWSPSAMPNRIVVPSTLHTLTREPAWCNGRIKQSGKRIEHRISDPNFSFRTVALGFARVRENVVPAKVLSYSFLEQGSTEKQTNRHPTDTRTDTSRLR